MHSNDLVYLKPNVVIEPLFQKWYAWSHLISPATAGLNIIGRHLAIMDSYMSAPKIHEAAARNPKMRGGPFIDLESKYSGEIEKLKAVTVNEQRDLILLAESIGQLHALLAEKGKGFSIEPLYKEVPELLRGYVELIYDLNNHPSFRLFETLLYNSKFYDKSYQSIALWLTNNDERPFVLSTPRLDIGDVLHQPIDFSSEIIDEISKMKRHPGSFSRIHDLLNIPPDKESLFRSFFTDEAPPPYRKYEGDQVRMRYFGHACILVETKDISILLDPLISYYGYQQEVDRFSDIDLPETIDYVLITHNHQDHILLETLLPLRNRIKNIVVPRTSSGKLQDPGLKLMFNNIGFKNVIEIGEMETIRFADCTITGVPFIGEHSDLDIQAKICHHVQIQDFSMLFMADSCNLENQLYKNIHQLIGDVDVLFLGMECEGAPLSWLYGPLMPRKLERDKDQSRRLSGSDFERGKGLVQALNPMELYVYAMGQEPWLEYISSIKYTPESHPIVQSDKLIKWCGEKGIIAERLFGEKEILYNKHKNKLAAAF
jgi:L-ascorbate metabolism protein UlaG (beta-lactamase superfamily)